MELENQVAIITGAASGIGRTTALTFVSEGAIAIAVDKQEKMLHETAGMIREQGGQCLPIVADVSISSRVEDMVRQTVDKYGRIDILVNNAGVIGPMMNIWEVEEEDWDDVFNNNLKSVWLCSKYVSPVMMRQKSGNIVNVASIAGKEVSEGIAAYSATKAGVIALSRSFAKELAPFGIRVNAVSPALTDTPMVSFMSQELKDFLVTKIPIGRMGRPEDTAQIILFLASERSSFVLGACYNVSGGRGEH
jgi:3-oxoacyl-[acyl-carrier protein] reductase